jgi:hypothetical protein
MRSGRTELALALHSFQISTPGRREVSGSEFAIGRGPDVDARTERGLVARRRIG